MKKKSSLKDLLSLLKGTQKAQRLDPCDSIDQVPPLDIPYPKTDRSSKHHTTDKNKFTGDIMGKISSTFKPSSGDESGIDDNPLTSIFTRILTGAKKKKKG